MHANKDNYKIHNAIIKELSKINYEVIYINNKNYFVNLELLFKKLQELNVKIVYVAVRDSRKKTLDQIIFLGDRYKLGVIFSSPTNNKALQVVDFVSWVIFRKLEHGNDKYYFALKFSQK